VHVSFGNENISKAELISLTRNYRLTMWIDIILLQCRHLEGCGVGCNSHVRAPYKPISVCRGLAVVRADYLKILVFSEICRTVCLQRSDSRIHPFTRLKTNLQSESVVHKKFFFWRNELSIESPPGRERLLFSATTNSSNCSTFEILPLLLAARCQVLQMVDCWWNARMWIGFFVMGHSQEFFY